MEKEHKLNAVKLLTMDPDGTVVVVFMSLDDGRQVEAINAEEFVE